MKIIYQNMVYQDFLKEVISAIRTYREIEKVIFTREEFAQLKISVEEKQDNRFMMQDGLFLFKFSASAPTVKIFEGEKDEVSVRGTNPSSSEQNDPRSGNARTEGEGNSHDAAGVTRSETHPVDTGRHQGGQSNKSPRLPGKNHRPNTDGDR